MKNKIAKTAWFTLLAAALAVAPANSRAADATNAPAAAAPAHKPHSLPFHGSVASVDSAAMTFTVGDMTMAMTSETRIIKDGKPAVFADITAGEAVRGSYKKDADGKLNAVSVKIGGAPRKDAPASTNAPAAS
jgi:hypothetical protein